jgi:hypothetical protein
MRKPYKAMKLLEMMRKHKIFSSKLGVPRGNWKKHGMLCIKWWTLACSRTRQFLFPSPCFIFTPLARKKLRETFSERKKKNSRMYFLKFFACYRGEKEIWGWE